MPEGRAERAVEADRLPREEHGRRRAQRDDLARDGRPSSEHQNIQKSCT
jgi:hypothetical protein